MRKLITLALIILGLLPATAFAAPASVIATGSDTFAPADVTVNQGEAVTWTFKATHNVTGTGFKSGNLSSGQTYTHAFDTPGDFKYTCTLHGGMDGIVHVLPQASSQPTAPAAPAGAPSSTDVPTPVGSSPQPITPAGQDRVAPKVRVHRPAIRRSSLFVRVDVTEPGAISVALVRGGHSYRKSFVQARPGANHIRLSRRFVPRGHLRLVVTALDTSLNRSTPANKIVTLR